MINQFLNYFKHNNIEVPISVGKLIARTPFSSRPGIGKNYKKQKAAINLYPNLNSDQKKEYIFGEFYKIFVHAYLNIPFYSELYQKHKIKISDINSFSDIRKIPIISKKDLIKIPLEERSYPIKNRLKVNTGGSSGKPFSFYMDPLRYGNEWVHIHSMWSKLGYKPKALKLNFDGRATVKNFIQYDFIRNSLRLDIYANPFEVCKKLINICKKHRVEYLHGYPSAIYEFALHCKDHEPGLVKLLRSTLKGAFLSSEFPSPQYRDFIEDTFDISTQSFYGHTETCVMAVENEKYEYDVFQTYGYAEGVAQKDNKTCLIGTSYYNFASPLIRYDTEDGIEITKEDAGILNTFSIKEGRIGEFILDKDNKKISLTGLIFGRHHKLFEVSKHVQIKQIKPGEATILYVSDKTLGSNIYLLFDANNVNIKFSFKKIDQPILSTSGKVNLLVK